jgi:hypothetical protein
MFRANDPSWSGLGSRLPSETRLCALAAAGADAVMPRARPTASVIMAPRIKASRGPPRVRGVA